jgi:Tol biopolymer transport system component
VEFRESKPVVVLAALAAAACGSGEDVSIATVALPIAVVSQPYAAQVTAMGGAEPFTWSLGADAPEELTLGTGDRTASLGGELLEVGDFEVTVRVEDADGGVAERTFGLEVVAPLQITTDALPDGASETAYAATIEAVGGSGRDRIWSVVEGALPDGLALDRAGTPSTSITGSPASGTDGTHRFTVQVEDAGLVRATRAFELELANGGLRFVTRTLERAAYQTPYQATIEVEGGVAPYAWRTTAGNPPPGITLSSATSTSARLRGTPTTVGRYDFEVEVEDATGATTKRIFIIDVGRTVTLTTSVLPPAIRGEPYSVTIETTSGSLVGYRWTVTGALPRGLTLPEMGAPNVELTGTPVETGTFDFEISVVDAAGAGDERDFTLDVLEPLVIEGEPLIALPNARGAEPYVATVSATGGAGPYAWRVAQGSLPSGVSLGTDGTPAVEVSGLPLELGTFTVTIAVTDTSGQEATANVELTVDLPSTLPTIVTSTLPDAVVCDGYHQPLTATGGSNVDYVWSITAGALPPGLRLSPTGDPTARIDGGLGEQTGSYTFTVRVTDLFGQTDDATFTVDVVDGLSGFRWVAMANDLEVRNQRRMHLANVCGPPGPPIDVTPANAPPGGDAFSNINLAGFSPDGAAFAYIGDLTVDDRADLYVVPLVTGAPGTVVRATASLPFTATAGAADLRWSPDGSMLAFRADVTTDGAYELFVMDLSNPEVPGPPLRVSPAWTDPTHTVVDNGYVFAPDNSQIAYVADTELVGRPWVVDISAVDSGGAPGSPRAVNATPGIGRGSPNLIWTVDARGLLYAGTFNDPLIWEPWWSDVSGAVVGAPVPIGRPTGVIPPSSCFWSSDDHGAGAALAPDGSKIVIGCPEGVQYREMPFVVDLTGPTPSAPVRLLDVAPANFTAGTYIWSPDGSKLALLSDHQTPWQFEAYVVDMTGAFPAVPQNLEHPGYGPNTMAATTRTALQWSPDSRWLSVQGDLDIDEREGTYVANLGDGPPFHLHRVHPLSSAVNEVTDGAQFSWDSRYLAVIGFWGRPTIHMVDLQQPLGTWSFATSDWPAASSPTGWFYFWQYFWTPSNDLVLAAGPRVMTKETWSIRIDAAPPYTARRISPIGTTPATRVDNIWGQGFYARRHHDQLRWPLF